MIEDGLLSGYIGTPLAAPVRAAGPGKLAFTREAGRISASLRRLGCRDRGRDVPPSARAACPATALGFCPRSAPPRARSAPRSFRRDNFNLIIWLDERQHHKHRERTDQLISRKMAAWCAAGSEELQKYPTIWRTEIGTIQKDFFEINSGNAMVRVVIVPGSNRF